MRLDLLMRGSAERSGVTWLPSRSARAAPPPPSPPFAGSVDGRRAGVFPHLVGTPVVRHCEHRNARAHGQGVEVLLPGVAADVTESSAEGHDGNELGGFEEHFDGLRNVGERSSGEPVRERDDET